MEGERYLLEKELPELNELDRGVWSLDQARQFADALQRKLFASHRGRADPWRLRRPADRPPTCPAGSASPRWPPRSTPRPSVP